MGKYYLRQRSMSNAELHLSQEAYRLLHLDQKMNGDRRIQVKEGCISEAVADPSRSHFDRTGRREVSPQYG